MPFRDTTAKRSRVPGIFETYAPPLEVLRKDAEARPKHYGAELCAAVKALLDGKPVRESVKTDLVLTWQRRTAPVPVKPVVRAKPKTEESSFEEQGYEDPIDLAPGDVIVG